MKHIILRTLAVVGIALTVLLSAAPCHAAQPPDSTPSIESIRIYRNLLETGDRLAVVYFNLPYTTPPPDPAAETYIWEFIDSDNTTVLGSTVGYSYVNTGYGYQVISFYFDAAAALAWNPPSPYTVRLRGNPVKFATPPQYDYPVNSSYYTQLSTPDDVRAELTSDILIIAGSLDIHWGLATSLITEEEAARFLSIFGQAYFRGCIFSIQSMAPGLFPMALRNIEITSRNWTDTYVASLEGQHAGTWVETARAAGATLFGVAYDLLSLIMVLFFVAGAVVGNTTLTNDHWNGLIDAAFIIVIATRIGMLGLGYASLIAALCIIYIGIRLRQMGVFG